MLHESGIGTQEDKTHLLQLLLLAHREAVLQGHLALRRVADLRAVADEQLFFDGVVQVGREGEAARVDAQERHQPAELAHESSNQHQLNKRRRRKRVWIFSYTW